MANRKQTQGKLNGEPCPVCHQTMGRVFGPRNAVGIVVTDEPELTDQGFSYPMQIIRNELSRFGVDLYGLRVTSLYRHLMGKEDDPCRNEHSKLLWQEFEGKSIIFALGGEIVKLLTGKVSTLMSGLVVQPDTVSGLVVCATNPAVAWHGMIGETRLACERFAQEYLKIEAEW